MGCNTHPKATPCSNAGDCAAAGAKFAYCTESHCVECLGDSSCGDGNLCVEGLCQRHCRDGRDCPSGDACTNGMCGGG